MPESPEPPAQVPAGFAAASGGRVGVDPQPGGGVLVRDELSVGGPVLSFTADEWIAFVAGVKNGEFDVEVG